MYVPKKTGKSLNFLFAILLLSTLVLSGCSSKSNLTTTFVAPAYVQISLSPSAVLPGQSATLTWSSTNATSCTGSGAWSGTLQSSGAMNVMLQGAASQAYTLVCTGDGLPQSKTVTLALAPADGACAVSGAVRAHAKRMSHRRKLTGSPS